VRVILDAERIAVNPTTGNQVTAERIPDIMRHAETILAGTTETATEAGHHHPILHLAPRRHHCRQVIERNIGYQHPDHLN
jgi:hypothetical protein